MGITVKHLRVSRTAEAQNSDLVRRCEFRITHGSGIDSVRAVLGGKYSSMWYEKVATVETDDLETAFACTNNITHLWVQNHNVVAEPSLSGSFRSTSVGDILVRGEELFVVAPMGFTKL